MAFQAVIFVLLMFAATVKTQKGGVDFQNEKVILTCPGIGDWYKGDKMIPRSETSNSYDFEYEQGQYKCHHNGENYHFYVRGRTCKNCIELKGEYFIAIIFADAIGSIVVMVIIYRCCKKKSSAEPPPVAQQRSKPAKNRAAYPEDSAYERLNPTTRVTDTYSTVVTGGTGSRTG
ncbi:T-cell surface glycoprotein CD3 epsilon chain-like [Cyprinodon tularosa]|uniref:T-cell surface glycoprotein CD3 epsilon chain-like n=1 Tax=Cyprinodon tularosa TaxID=77115 RepID=UPI0018E22240|nr:T-cell surface glycoprotein CD3 epsilon chain-like [Cyprinodon tularosa]